MSEYLGVLRYRPETLSVTITYLLPTLIPTDLVPVTEKRVWLAALQEIEFETGRLQQSAIHLGEDALQRMW